MKKNHLAPQIWNVFSQKLNYWFSILPVEQTFTNLILELYLLYLRYLFSEWLKLHCCHCGSVGEYITLAKKLGLSSCVLDMYSCGHTNMYVQMWRWQGTFQGWYYLLNVHDLYIYINLYNVASIQPSTWCLLIRATYSKPSSCTHHGQWNNQQISRTCWVSPQ